MIILSTAVFAPRCSFLAKHLTMAGLLSAVFKEEQKLIFTPPPPPPTVVSLIQANLSPKSEERPALGRNE